MTPRERAPSAASSSSRARSAAGSGTVAALRGTEKRSGSPSPGRRDRLEGESERRARRTRFQRVPGQPHARRCPGRPFGSRKARSRATCARAFARGPPAPTPPRRRALRRGGRPTPALGGGTAAAGRGPGLRLRAAGAGAGRGGAGRRRESAGRGASARRRRGAVSSGSGGGSGGAGRSFLRRALPRRGAALGRRGGPRARWCAFLFLRF